MQKLMQSDGIILVCDWLLPMVEHAAFAMSVNEAWTLLALVAAAALILVWCLGKPHGGPLKPLS